MNRKWLATQLRRCSTAAAVVVMTAVASQAMAQDEHSHGGAPQPPQRRTREQTRQDAALVQAVRDATARFQSSGVAEREGYALQFGCVSGSDYGAMGLHYVNGTFVGDNVINLEQPEIVLYEAQPDGSLVLTGADYLVLADPWNSTHDGPPQLMGQLFHYFEAPNRFNLPAFYTLHVWAWKDNPNGTFTNWNPNVSCDGYVPRAR